MDYLGYIQTWIWIWGIVSTSTVAVAIWAAITRLPGVVVFVLAVGTGVMCLIGLETALITYTKIKELLGSRYRRALARLDDFRTEGVVCGIAWFNLTRRFARSSMTSTPSRRKRSRLCEVLLP